MQFVRTTAIGLACAVPICAPASAAGGPTAPAPSRLAALAFPGWSDSPAGRLQTVTLPGGSAYRHYANWNAGENRVLVDPRLVLRLDATHLTLVAAMVPAGANGKPAAAHLTPMGLAAYQFELHGGAWRLARRQGLFGLRGFFGAATLRAVALSDRRQAVAVEYGSCWGGYCGTWLALYEAGIEQVNAEPAVDLALAGQNVDSSGDCMRRLQPLIKPHPQDPAARGEGARPDGHDCYAIEGGWSVTPSRGQPGDLVIRYQGALSCATAHAAPPVVVDQRQVLRYGDGKYRVVSGSDPVPSI